MINEIEMKEEDIIRRSDRVFFGALAIALLWVAFLLSIITINLIHSSKPQPVRKSRVRQIRQQELASPLGMDTASFRRAKKQYSNGLSRGAQPKSEPVKGVTGFPKGLKVHVITWRERNRIKRIETTEQGLNKKSKRTRLARAAWNIYYRYKKVTRVRAFKPASVKGGF